MKLRNFLKTIALSIPGMSALTLLAKPKEDIFGYTRKVTLRNCCAEFDPAVRFYKVTPGATIKRITLEDLKLYDTFIYHVSNGPLSPMLQCLSVPEKTTDVTMSGLGNARNTDCWKVECIRFTSDGVTDVTHYFYL